jgi:hypothetical protein
MFRLVPDPENIKTPLRLQYGKKMLKLERLPKTAQEILWHTLMEIKRREATVGSVLSTGEKDELMIRVDVGEKSLPSYIEFLIVMTNQLIKYEVSKSIAEEIDNVVHIIRTMRDEHQAEVEELKKKQLTRGPPPLPGFKHGGAGGGGGGGGNSGGNNGGKQPRMPELPSLQLE